MWSKILVFEQFRNLRPQIWRFHVNFSSRCYITCNFVPTLGCFIVWRSLAKLMASKGIFSFRFFTGLFSCTIWLLTFILSFASNFGAFWRIKITFTPSYLSHVILTVVFLIFASLNVASVKVISFPVSNLWHFLSSELRFYTAPFCNCRTTVTQSTVGRSGCAGPGRTSMLVIVEQ